MKLCYIIAATGHGSGGHFHSLATIVTALSAHNSILVVTIGRKSPVIGPLPVEKVHIPFDGARPTKLVRQLHALLVAHKVDLVNLFDRRIYFAVALSSAKAGVPIVVTKCGGPNPRWFFPRGDSLIVFSKEDQNFFDNDSRHRRIPIHFIPNRVNKVTPDKQRISCLPQASTSGPLIMMISRIGNHYESSIDQAISMVDSLNRDGYPCRLTVVGVREDSSVYERIASRASKHTVIVSDSVFTTKASCLLGAADVVVATGRGFMEGASLGKPLLTPLQGRPNPLLVSPASFPDVFRTNFSPRNSLKTDDDDNYAQICRVISCHRVRERIGEFTADLFAKHFDVNAAVGAYQRVYESTRQLKKMPPAIDLIYSWYIQAQAFSTGNRKWVIPGI